MTQLANDYIHHNKCVCQICTCTKHHCPHADAGIPLDGSTTYAGDFTKHPLHVWVKPKDKGNSSILSTIKTLAGAPVDRHYDYINSAYREHYPGHTGGPREKLKPRVKEENHSIPFNGSSEYRTNFLPKSVKREVAKPKAGYKPLNEPFDGTTTYDNDFTRKKLPAKFTKKDVQVDFPPGYRFEGSTTYGHSYDEKPLEMQKSYKPQERTGEKGPHDLNTIYRQEYVEKPLPTKCPILGLPKYQDKIHVPHAHLGYDCQGHTWHER